MKENKFDGLILVGAHQDHDGLYLKKSIESVPGYSIEAWDASIVPLELMVPEWLSNVSFFNSISRARLHTARIIPELAAYQLLVRARFTA
jgi:hypothetical protein